MQPLLPSPSRLTGLSGSQHPKLAPNRPHTSSHLQPKGSLSPSGSFLPASSLAFPLLSSLSYKILRRTVTGCTENYVRVIDNILEQKPGKDLVDFHEVAADGAASLFSRYYRAYEFPTKLQTLYKFCKFVFVFPKLYNLQVYPIIRRYVHLRRRKRERTMRRILEEIDDSNINLLSLDYVLFCESTYIPVNLKQFTKTKMAINNTMRLGWMCIGEAEPELLDQIPEGMHQTPKSPTEGHKWPFETEESTILGSNANPREQASFGDSAFVSEGGEVRTGKPGVQSSFGPRKSDFRGSHFLPNKPIKNVYSGYKKSEVEVKKPSPFVKPKKVSVYSKKLAPKGSYRTHSDNERTGAGSGSSRRIVIRELKPPAAKAERPTSERDLPFPPVKFALGTNKLMLSSARTIPLKKPSKTAHTPAGEATPGTTPLTSHSPAKWKPGNFPAPSRKKHKSFKAESHGTGTALGSDSNHESIQLAKAGKTSSERSVKMPLGIKRPVVNKRSLDEYSVKGRKSKLALPAEQRLEQMVASDSKARLALGRSPDLRPDLASELRVESEKMLTKNLTITEPQLAKELRDCNPSEFRLLNKAAPEKDLRTVLKGRPFLKSRLEARGVKPAKGQLSSTFQLLSKRHLVDQAKKSFASKPVKTYCQLEEVGERAEGAESAKPTSVEPRRDDSKANLSRLMKALLFRKV